MQYVFFALYHYRQEVVEMLKYYGLGILAVFFWSFNVIFGSHLVGVLMPWQISFFRWTIAAICLLPFTFRKIWKHRRLFCRQWRLVLALALIGITFSNTCVYYAAYTLPAIDMALISVTGPVFLILFAHFLGHIPVSKVQIRGIILAILGVLMIVLKGKITSFSFQSGHLWMILMAVSFGFYSYLVSCHHSGYRQVTMLSLSILIGALSCLPMFVRETLIHPLKMTYIDWDVILIILYMGIVNSVLAYLLWNIALQKVDSVRLSLVYYLMPIFSTLEAFLFLHEPIHRLQLVGGSIILMGIYLANHGRMNNAFKRKKK